MRIPIRLARALGNRTAKYRWFAIFYLILCFLVIPLAVFGLSMAGWIVMVSVGVPIIVLIIFVIIVNVMQSRWPRSLPECLRSWDFLPRPLHSLAPWDAVVTSTFSFCGRRCCCCCCKCSNCCQRNDEEIVRRESLEVYDNAAMSFDEDSKGAVAVTHF